ncbi:hypothetical protein Goklo_007418 [Gossypium klotzschianum]|uniref:Uncharacterized protein n=2 Tax=Gossypium klotzschianum TaxID=34286 RepID=A0A7J8WCR7_9ROSI|nr:hypothetical protein [Gossypium klotzschianum]
MLENVTIKTLNHMLAGYKNLLPVTRDSKVANISSMHAPMHEDVPFAFHIKYGLRLVNLRSPQGIQPVHVAN